jgi:hypothetical protein
MAKGGARVGAGRPKGSRTIKTGAVIRTLQTGGKSWKTALEWAMAVINDESADIEIKTRLAIACMPFQGPKYESIPANGGVKKQRDDAAVEAQKKATPFAAPKAPRLVSSRGDD